MLTRQDIIEAHRTEEQQWVKEHLKGLVLKPYFFKEKWLIIAEEDKNKVYKRLQARLSWDREQRARLWFLTIKVYRTEEEYVWLKIF